MPSMKGDFLGGAEHQIHRLVHWTLSLLFDGIVFCSFLSTSHSLLHFPISTAGPLSAHFIHIINILYLSSSQSLMKMLNNSKPNTHPSGPTGHFPLISCTTFHPSCPLTSGFLLIWNPCDFFFNPVLFELISWVQIWGMFYQVLIQVQTYRELHYIQIFFS